MCDVHPDPEVFRLRLGKALNYEYHEDSQTGLFQRRDPREGGAGLDIERGASRLFGGGALEANEEGGMDSVQQAGEGRAPVQRAHGASAGVDLQQHTLLSARRRGARDAAAAAATCGVVGSER